MKLNRYLRTTRYIHDLLGEQENQFHVTSPTRESVSQSHTDRPLRQVQVIHPDNAVLKQAPTKKGGKSDANKRLCIYILLIGSFLSLPAWQRNTILAVEEESSSPFSTSVMMMLGAPMSAAATLTIAVDTLFSP